MTTPESSKLFKEPSQAGRTRETPFSISRKIRFLKYGIFAALSLTFPVLLGLSFRPIADDYCIAVGVATEGLLSSVRSQYFEWSGALAADFLASLFAQITILIGTPVGYLLPCVIIFMTGYLSFYLLVCWSSVFGIVTAPNSRFIIAVVAFQIFILSQFGIPPSGGDVQFSYGYALLGWLAAAVSQFIPALILLIVLAIWIEYQRAGKRSYLVLSILLSLVLGQINFVAPLTLILLLLYLLLTKSKLIQATKATLLLTALVSLMMLANLLSPGTIARKAVIATSSNGPTFSSAIKVAHDLLANLTAAPVIGAIIVGFSYGLLSRHISREGLIRFIGFCLPLLGAAFVATFLTDIFGASEPWHVALLQLTIFLCVLSTSSLAGSTFRRGTTVTAGNLWVPILVALLFAGLALASSQVIHEVKARSSVQVTGGPAPIWFINDTEIPWIKECADNLNDR